MLVTIHIAPHERQEAIDAYRKHLTDPQVSQIEDAPEGSWITLALGGGPTRVTVEDDASELSASDLAIAMHSVGVKPA